MLSRILPTKGKQKINKIFYLLRARSNGAAVSKTAMFKLSHECRIEDILAFQLCFSTNVLHLFVSTYFPFNTFFLIRIFPNNLFIQCSVKTRFRFLQLYRCLQISSLDNITASMV